MSNWGYSALNAIPSPTEITVNSYSLSLDDSDANFRREHLVLADSAAGAGLVFTLAYEPVQDAGVQVYVNGSLQRLTTDFTISGQTLTMVVALEATDSLDVMYLGLEP